MFNNFHNNKYNSGVTLIELLVVISIFLIISTTVIFNHGKLNSSLTTQNLADDIALSIRKVQNYAIGVHGVYDPNSSSSVFNYGYGVHISTEAEPSDIYSGSKKSFVLFISSVNPFDTPLE